MKQTITITTRDGVVDVNLSKGNGDFVAASMLVEDLYDVLDKATAAVPHTPARTAEIDRRSSLANPSFMKILAGHLAHEKEAAHAEAVRE